MMSKDTLRLLEFEKIVDRIALFANSPAALPLIRALSPLRSKSDAELRLSLVEEIRELSCTGITLPLEPFEDIVTVIELARPDGSLLSTEELSLLVPVLRVSARVKSLFGYRSDVPLLTHAAADVNSFPDILEPLSRPSPRTEGSWTAPPISFSPSAETSAILSPGYGNGWKRLSGREKLLFSCRMISLPSGTADG